MAKQRILITIKTYPTLSRKCGETVCTAGVREDGSWVRIYPVPFRRLDEAEQYRKFDWLECDLVKSHKRLRFESHDIAAHLDAARDESTGQTLPDKPKMVLEQKKSRHFICSSTDPAPGRVPSLEAGGTFRPRICMALS